MTPNELAKSGSEHSQQRAFFAWCNMAEQYGIPAANDNNCYVVKDYAKAYYHGNSKISELRWIHAVHNQGHGDVVHGSRAKSEGVKAGILDIFFPYPMPDVHTRFLWHGLYIEMKVGKNTLTEEQKEFRTYCQRNGYAVQVAYNWQEAVDIVLKYLMVKEYNAGYFR